MTLLRITSSVSEDTLPLISQADGAQILVVDGGSRGVGGAAARGDDESWRDVDTGRGGGGLCDVSWLLVAVVGVSVVGGAVVCVVIEGGVTVAVVQVADPAGRPPLVWTAGH